MARRNYIKILFENSKYYATRLSEYIISAPYLKIKNAILRHIRTSKRVTIDGRTYSIPLHLGLGHSNIAFHNREPNVAKVIQRLMRERKGAVIDIGANIGQTLLMIYHFDPYRQYIGFEPNPECVQYIEKLRYLNSMRNASIVGCGLGDEVKIVPLYLRDGFSDTASIIENFRPADFYNRNINIPILPADTALSWVKDVDRISFIKIDVEGAELEVIRGLKETIKNKSPHLIFEVLPDKIFLTGQKLGDAQSAIRKGIAIGIEEFLRSHGYSIYRIKSDGSLNSVRSLEGERDATLSECNYVAIPEER